MIFMFHHKKERKKYWPKHWIYKSSNTGSSYRSILAGLYNITEKSVDEFAEIIICCFVSKL